MKLAFYQDPRFWLYVGAILAVVIGAIDLLVNQSRALTKAGDIFLIGQGLAALGFNASVGSPIAMARMEQRRRLRDWRSGSGVSKGPGS